MARSTARSKVKAGSGLPSDEDLINRAANAHTPPVPIPIEGTTSRLEEAREASKQRAVTAPAAAPTIAGADTVALLTALRAAGFQIVPPGETAAPAGAAPASDDERFLKGMALIAASITQGMSHAQDKHDRRVNRSNPDYEGKSVFRPEGTAYYAEGEEHELKWHRQPFHNNAKIYMDQLLPAEVHEWNALSKMLEGPGKRIMARDGRWYAEVNRNGDQLHVFTPVVTENEKLEMNMVPSIIFLLRELRLGQKAADPTELLARLETLEQDNAKLAGGMADLSSVLARLKELETENARLKSGG